MPRVASPKQKVVTDVREAGGQPSQENQATEVGDNQVRVTCFNCAEWGHFSSDCKKPKVCLICQIASHVGKDCPEWQKPLEPTLYLGSVAQGLGFFHVEVHEEENRMGYLKFVDNCDVLTIEEGEINLKEIVENMQLLFDPKWHW
jgi:hypothetical protein